jgi:hypothetical protein
MALLNDKPKYKYIYDKHCHDVITSCNKITIFKKNKVILNITNDSERIYILNLVDTKSKYFEGAYKNELFDVAKCMESNKLTLKYDKALNITINMKKINIYDLIKFVNMSDLKLKLNITFYSVQKMNKMFINAKVTDISVISDVIITQIRENPKYKLAYSSKSKSIVQNIMKILK